jgi:hypothetical protein
MLSHELFALGCPQILQISASQVARIIGVSHWCLLLKFNLKVEKIFRLISCGIAGVCRGINSC